MYPGHLGVILGGYRSYFIFYFSRQLSCLDSVPRPWLTLVGYSLSNLVLSGLKVLLWSVFCRMLLRLPLSSERCHPWRGKALPGVHLGPPGGGWGCQACGTGNLFLELMWPGACCQSSHSEPAPTRAGGLPSTVHLGSGRC